MWSMVPLESVGEYFVINFLGTQFQAQKASMNLLRKSGPLGHFRTRNLLENTVCLPNKNYPTKEQLKGNMRRHFQTSSEKNLFR
jgi:hypothetical protein